MGAAFGTNTNATYFTKEKSNKKAKNLE